ALSPPLLRQTDLRDRAVRRPRLVGRAARPLRRAAHLGDELSVQPRRRLRRRRPAVLRGALSSRLAAPVAAWRDAGRAVRRGLVAESARRSVDLLGAVRRRAARAGPRAGGACRQTAAVVRAAGAGRGAAARLTHGAGCARIA